MLINDQSPRKDEIKVLIVYIIYICIHTHTSGKYICSSKYEANDF